MSYRTLHQAVIDKLNAESAVTDLVVQINYSHTKFDGFPAIVVANSSNENDYSSNDSRKQTYSFSVFVYYLFNDNDEYEAAVKAVESIMDEVITIFNKTDSLQPDAQLTMPVPSSVVAVEAGDEGVYVVGEVIVQTTKYQNC